MAKKKWLWFFKKSWKKKSLSGSFLLKDLRDTMKQKSKFIIIEKSENVHTNMGVSEQLELTLDGFFYATWRDFEFESKANRASKDD